MILFATWLLHFTHYKTFFYKALILFTTWLLHFTPPTFFFVKFLNIKKNFFFYNLELTGNFTELYTIFFCLISVVCFLPCENIKSIAVFTLVKLNPYFSSDILAAQLTLIDKYIDAFQKYFL